MQSPHTHLIFIDGVRLMLWKFYLSNKQFRFISFRFVSRFHDSTINGSEPQVLYSYLFGCACVSLSAGCLSCLWQVRELLILGS